MNASPAGMATADDIEHDIIEREKRSKRSILMFAIAIVLVLALWLMFVRFL